MSHIIDSDEEDDGSDRPSPLLQTQRFNKSAPFGTRDFRSSEAKSKHHAPGGLDINLNRINNDDDSLDGSDDETNTRTGRSTSSGTTSQLTPKPRERSFLKSDGAKPTTKPRHINIDDDDRNVFGQATMKPSPRRPITTLREDEEENQSFMSKFSSGKQRKSPTDMFGSNAGFDSHKNNRRPSHDREDDDRYDSDDNSRSQKISRQTDFRKGRHSPAESELAKSRRDSHRSREDSDDDEKHSSPLTAHQYSKKRQSVPEQPQVNHRHEDLFLVELKRSLFEECRFQCHGASAHVQPTEFSK